MRFKSFMVAGLLAGVSTPAAAQVMPLDQAAKAFGVRESIQDISVSPSGNRLVMVSAGAGRSSLVQVVELPSMTVKTIMSSGGDPESLQWCDFASDTQLVCRYTGNVKVEDEPVSHWRLVTFGTDGKNLKQLGQRESSYDAWIRTYDGSVLDWLPDDDRAILMTRYYTPEAYKMNTRIVSDDKGLGVDRIELPSLKSSRVEAPRDGVSGYMSDGRGNVRIRRTYELSGDRLSGIYRNDYRTSTSRDWKDLGYFDVKDDSGIQPLAVDADTDSLYLLKKLDGRFALYRRKLDGSNAETLVAADKKVDVDDVVRFGHGKRVIGYTYATDVRHAVYFDPEFNKLSATIAKALPNQPLIDFVGSSSDGSKLLIVAASDTQPGIYYLYDRKSRALNELALVRPELEGKTLASVKSITYPSADGVQVPAYLTLPAGKEAKGLPAVVLPHGGPSARDEWGFDWLAQFLAARGYAVIQPNFRGSAGYGENWLPKEGFRNWRASVGDINAAARYLAAQGIADPKKVAILGWSYGGYAALQSVVTDPALYRASIAIAPVTDLSLLKQEYTYSAASKVVRDFVGSGEHIVAGSPLRNAGKIQVPVLLVHGDLDVNVGIVHSDKMASALPQAELIRYKGLDHGLDDSNARIEMLTKIGQLLDRTIGK